MTKSNQQIALAVAVLLGLGVYFYVERQKQRPVAADDAEAIAEYATGISESIQTDLQVRLAEQATGEAQERLDSPLGQAMFSQCFEWTAFHENHPTESTLENRDRSCDEFRAYIDNGTLPD